MKKVVIFSLVALMLGVLPATAQIRFGVKGGANISKVHFRNEILKAENVTGLQIGPMMEATFPVFGLGLDAAVLYTQKGLQIREGVINRELASDFLEVPVNLRWKFGVPVVKGFLTAGPYVGFRIGGDKIWNVLESQIEQKNFAAGLNFGAGVEVFTHFQVGINYGLGLTDNYSSYSISADDVRNKLEGGKHQTWSITAAILF